MSDLVEFVRSRLDDDERSAQAAAEPFMWGDRTGMAGLHPQILTYVRRWVPARVLRDVEAKRRILSDHTTPHTVGDGWCVECGGACTHEGEGECSWHGADGCSTLRALASIWSNHPDYREEWAQ